MQNDADELRSERMRATRSTRVIGGVEYDEDDVPDPADLLEPGER